MALKIVVDGGELLVKTGEAKDDNVFTRLAGVRALLLLVVVLVNGENDMPGSAEVDVLVIAGGSEVRSHTCSLDPGPLIGKNRDTEGCQPLS